MKKILITLLLLPVFVFAQTTEEFDFVAPIHDGMAAVKKGELWGFINDNGIIVISFRNDLVSSKSDDGTYPIFKNNRCLISKEKNGITYFGYIDKTGKTVIAPEFLNALNFDNKGAVVLKLVKEELGRNEILDKTVIAHKYFEVVIDSNGSIKTYLNPKGTNIVLDKKYFKKPPKITSKKISDNLYTILNENKKWILITINN